MPPCLTLSIIRYGSRVKWSNPGKGVAPSPTPWCSKLSKREPSGHPRLWSPTLLHIVYNFHMTCSNSSFSLTMVMPTSHFSAFPWLCCLLPIGYSVLWAYTSTTITEFNHAHRSGDFLISSTGCTCFQHNNCGHGDISAITLLILSLSGYNPVNILWYTAHVDMMTFRWSHRSYQSFCQQNPPYSHPQVMLIYYTCVNTCTKSRTVQSLTKSND